LAAIERSPNTVKAYAHDLKDWWTYLAGRGLDWRAVTLEEVGGFVAWLPPPSMQISWPRTPAPPFERERDASPTDMEACLTTRLLGDRDTVWSHRISRAETQTHQTPRRVRW